MENINNLCQELEELFVPSSSINLTAPFYAGGLWSVACQSCQLSVGQSDLDVIRGGGG